VRARQTWLAAGIAAAALSLAGAYPALAQVGGTGKADAGQAAAGIATPLATGPPDVANGRRIVADRRVGLCLLCHAGPFPEERFQGSLAPSLAGAGSRLSQAELRLRIVDSRRVNPASIMPPYFRAEGLTQVASAYAGKTLLTANEVEDVVAFLATLKD
jgi:sulfur-oxidizing protein SoxX